jgi:hypothetical protein
MATVTAGYNWTSGEVVTPAKLNSTAAPTVVVANDEITTAKILNAAVTTAKIADANVTTAKIADAAVNNAKLADGAIVQVVNTFSNTGVTVGVGTAIPVDNTIPQNTEGIELMTASITPKSATNKILIQVEISGSNAGATQPAGMLIALFKDSVANAFSFRAITLAASAAGQVFISYLDSPSTTSSITYKVRGGYSLSGNGWYFNRDQNNNAIWGGVWGSSITLTEIKAS